MVLRRYVWLDADGVTRSKTMTMTARPLKEGRANFRLFRSEMCIPGLRIWGSGAPDLGFRGSGFGVPGLLGGVWNSLQITESDTSGMRLPSSVIV